MGGTEWLVARDAAGGVGCTATGEPRWARGIEHPTKPTAARRAGRVGRSWATGRVDAHELTAWIDDCNRLAPHFLSTFPRSNGSK
jgi:hypothetical protein